MPSRRDLFEATVSGAQNAPFLPRLRSDSPASDAVPHTLENFRTLEGKEQRKARLRELWHQLPQRRDRRRVQAADRDARASASARALGLSPTPVMGKLTPEVAEKLRDLYDEELLGSCGPSDTATATHPIGWKAFVRYAEAKETELWSIFHDELDLDGNGHLDANELSHALTKTGIMLSPKMLDEFMNFLTSSPYSHAISFGEFRDFLLLLPRKISTAEIYRYYEVRKFMGEDGRGAGRVTMEGDVSLSAEDRPPPPHYKPAPAISPEPVDVGTTMDLEEEDDDDRDYIDDEDEHHGWPDGHTAIKFLAAGGIAGAVSRTATAPFDRLKVFLITRPPDLGGPSLTSKPSVNAINNAIARGIARIYSEGGLFAFWTGNGLSVAKILPESAIKFFSYESSKRAFAKYWDKVDDPRDISGLSRFLSGGIGGISSQLSIYPVETLKTQMMSNTGEVKLTLASAARHLWSLGGLRAYYRGLAIGLLGVFPYSAIDMSTFEALKLTYIRSTGKEEPGMLAVLAFGSVSGGVGASSVYPLNLVRTRLQASGSSGHPQRYTGVWDVAVKTYERDGWRGFYRGLFPTLAKVVPAVSITYVVYEHSKRKLGV